MKIDGYPAKKNKLINRLKGLLNAPAVYNGAPEFSYDIGPYRVFRDASVAVMEEDADKNILNILFDEKLLIDPDPVGRMLSQEPSDDEEPEEAVEPQPVVVTQAVPLESGSRFSDQPVVISDRIITASTLVNLLNMIHSKGELINNAIGRPKAFWVSESVVSELSYHRPTTFRDVLKVLGIRERNSLVRGIEITQTEITFSGFPETDDYMVRRAYEKLAEAMYTYAVRSRWISSRKTDTRNEKYAFRSWLYTIGLGGSENGSLRNFFLRKLSGNSAYRTQSQLAASRDKRQERYQKKKEADNQVLRTPAIMTNAENETARTMATAM